MHKRFIKKYHFSMIIAAQALYDLLLLPFPFELLHELLLLPEFSTLLLEHPQFLLPLSQLLVHQTSLPADCLISSCTFLSAVILAVALVNLFALTFSLVKILACLLTEAKVYTISLVQVNVSTNVLTVTTLSTVTDTGTAT